MEQQDDQPPHLEQPLPYPVLAVGASKLPNATAASITNKFFMFSPFVSFLRIQAIVI